MSAHWIVDDTGSRAIVDTDADLSTWTLLYGWHVSTQPDVGSNVQTHVRNPTSGGAGCIPYAALASGWAELGWEPGPPPIPTDQTRPALPTPSPRPPSDEGLAAASETTKTGAAGVTKEKTRG